MNLHLVAMPMFERHTTLNVFNMISKFMDVLYSKWRAKLISMSTDGENTMIGRHAGVMTRIVACAKHKVLQIWCAPHQINIIVKASIESISDDNWVKFCLHILGLSTHAGHRHHQHEREMPKEDQPLGPLRALVHILQVVPAQADRLHQGEPS
jgi:hypothetical protein